MRVYCLIWIDKLYEAGVQFARSEGIIPAPESNHAISACIDEALKCKQSGEARTLFSNLSGHGHFDMASYDKFFSKELEDYAYPAEAIEEALHHLSKVPQHKDFCDDWVVRFTVRRIWSFSSFF